MKTSKIVVIENGDRYSQNLVNAYCDEGYFIKETKVTDDFWNGHIVTVVLERED